MAQLRLPPEGGTERDREGRVSGFPLR
jgi:hypothetical protein